MRLHNLLALTAICAITLNWAQQLTGTEWDWDINHMMYFGQRLLAGEFHWTAEFDDKLPINQMIFALPAAFHSVRVWQIMSIAACIGGAYSVRWLILHGLAARADLPADARNSGAWAGFLATLIGFSFAPGGIHHINPMAASGAVAAIALLTHAMAERKVYPAAFLLAAVLASIAIGMRPYLALAVCITPVWLGLRTTRGLRYSLGMTALWIGSITLFGVLANLLPYAVLGEMQAFQDGLHILRQTLTPSTVKGIIYVQLQVFLFPGAPEVLLIFLAALTAALLSLPKARLSAYWRDVLVLSAVMPILIEVMILSKHFWPHYTQMFMPFFAIGAGVLMAEISASPTKHMTQRACVLVSTVVLSIATLNAGAGLWANRGATHHLDHLAQAFAGYLESRSEDTRDFLSPEQMYIHWALQEPRHGFPHAANSRHIAQQGWFTAVSMPSGMDLPSNTQEYCAKLVSGGPSLVMGTLNGYVAQCLTNSSTYARVPWDMPGYHGLSGVLVFERSNSAGNTTVARKE